MSDSLPTLRQRIKVANDLGSVVKTMKAMAAASISQFEQAALALEGYSRSIELCLAIYYRNRADAKLVAPSTGTNHKSPRSALLVFGTDQGMAGQFNESLADEITTRIATGAEQPILWVVGERIQYRLENFGLKTTRAFPTPNSIEGVAPLIAEVLSEIEQEWSTTQLGTVEICHNKALSRTHYEVTWNRLLPLDRDWEARLAALPWPTPRLPELIHGDDNTLGSFISEFLFVSLYKACSESLAAENGARLSAMQRAEKNIDERLREFRLAFNHQRQKAIDEELFDLLSGFEMVLDSPKGKRESETIN